MKTNEKPTPESLRALYLEHGRDLPRFEKEMKKVIKQGYRSEDLLLIGAANHYLASAHYLYGGERGTVLLYAIKAAAMLEKTEAYRILVSNCNLLGIAYLSHENYQMALEAYYRAYEIVKKAPDCRPQYNHRTEQYRQLLLPDGGFQIQHSPV